MDPWPTSNALRERSWMRWAMPQPCMGPRARDLRTRRSSVPWRTSDGVSRGMELPASSECRQKMWDLLPNVNRSLEAWHHPPHHDRDVVGSPAFQRILEESLAGLAGRARLPQPLGDPRVGHVAGETVTAQQHGGVPGELEPGD